LTLVGLRLEHASAIELKRTNLKADRPAYGGSQRALLGVSKYINGNNSEYQPG
jgi:hypothetical protein